MQTEMFGPKPSGVAVNLFVRSFLCR